MTVDKIIMHILARGLYFETIMPPVSGLQTSHFGLLATVTSGNPLKSDEVINPKKPAACFY